MTTGPINLCLGCVHLVRTGEGLQQQATCAAYPDGIPPGIWSGSLDHQQRQPGDNGIRFDADGAYGQRVADAYNATR